MVGKKGETLESLKAAPEEEKDKLRVLRKAIAEGTYEIRSDDVASKIIRDSLLECALTPGDREFTRRRG